VRSFSKGLYKAHTIQHIPEHSTPPAKASGKEDFLLLALLFILLAASPSLGVDSKYFFIIIMALIGLGGVSELY